MVSNRFSLARRPKREVTGKHGKPSHLSVVQPSPVPKTLSDSEMLELAGRLLEGERWKVPMGRRMNLDERHLRYILDGERPMAQWTWDFLVGSIDERITELMDLRSRILTKRK